MGTQRADRLRHRYTGEGRAHLKIIGGIRPDNGSTPPVSSQTYEAPLCTVGLTIDGALTRICTIAPEANTNGCTRAAMALVAIGSSPPPRSGDPVKFYMAYFGVGHDAGLPSPHVLYVAGPPWAMIGPSTETELRAQMRP